MFLAFFVDCGVGFLCVFQIWESEMRNVSKSLYPEVRRNLAKLLRTSRSVGRRVKNKSHVLNCLAVVTDTYNKSQFVGVNLFKHSMYAEVVRDLCIDLWCKLGGDREQLAGL